MLRPTHSSAVARVVLAGIASLGTVHTQSPEGEQAAEGARFDALLERLSRPLQPRLVREAVRHPQVADSETARTLVLHLTVHGGVPAVDGLLTLARHSDAGVRLAAVRSIATLGMRGADVVQGARDAMDDYEPTVRRAAIEALGAVGEAEDVGLLIELLSDEEESAVAFRALRSLTGARVARDRRLWSYWWSIAEKDLDKRVEAAIQVLKAGGPDVQLVDARRTLLRGAWFARLELEEVVREWLGSGDPRLRLEAFGLVAGARLADLAEDVERALDFEIEPEVLSTGRECAVALGIRAEPPSAAPPGIPR